MDPATAPLLLLQLPYLRAIEPRSGQLLWETVVGEGSRTESSPGRLFVSAHGLFVMAGARIWLVDVATGRITGGIELPFTPDTAVFEGECFYVANVPDAAAVGVDVRPDGSTALSVTRIARGGSEYWRMHVVADVDGPTLSAILDPRTASQINSEGCTYQVQTILAMGQGKQVVQVVQGNDYEDFPEGVLGGAVDELHPQALWTWKKSRGHAFAASDLLWATADGYRVGLAVLARGRAVMGVARLRAHALGLAGSLGGDRCLALGRLEAYRQCTAGRHAVVPNRSDGELAERLHPGTLVPDPLGRLALGLVNVELFSD